MKINMKNGLRVCFKNKNRFYFMFESLCILIVVIACQDRFFFKLKADLTANMNRLPRVLEH